MGDMRSEPKNEKVEPADPASIFEEVQIARLPETEASRDALRHESGNWKEQSIPALQRKVVDAELANLHRGIIAPVYASLIHTLKQIPLAEFSLLDAACASGFYSEVIRMLDKRNIHYAGSDYSRAMVDMARSLYPDEHFEVQDLTSLTYDVKSIDVVLLSGVLEHIPDYEKALQEACRVAKKYVILHRLPFTDHSENEYTLGSQYSIKTPRIYFARKVLLADLERHHPFLSHEQDSYPATRKLRDQWKLRLKVFLGLESAGRQTKTLLLSRR